MTAWRTGTTHQGGLWSISTVVGPVVISIFSSVWGRRARSSLHQEFSGRCRVPPPGGVHTVNSSVRSISMGRTLFSRDENEERRITGKQGWQETLDARVGGDIAVDGIVSARERIDGHPGVLGAQECTPLTGSIGAGANSQPHRLAESVLHGTALSAMLMVRDELHRGIHYLQASADRVVAQ